MFKDLIRTVLENVLEGELEEKLGYSKYDCRHKETDDDRNGHHKKTMKSSLWELELKIPRDRKGDYEPQLIKKQ